VTVLTSSRARRREIDGLVGLTIFLGATAMLFVAMLFAYAVLRAQSPAWPPAGTPPFPRLAAGGNGLVLLVAGLALRAGRGRAAFLLGGCFLGGQVLLWRQLVAAHLGPGTGTLGDVFVALSGFHALHVLGGLGALAVAWARGRRRPDLSEGPPERNRALVLYWDFVFAVWAVIYVVVCVL
jgi:heme/copper-type cytochrome/quinol oxidase subunit 3